MKDENVYDKHPSTTDHGIMSFFNDIGKLEEGKYVLVYGQLVKQ